jgi:iron(III) transport system ATP-binding protein
MDPLIVRGITHYYGDRCALNQVDLTLAAGEVTAILGVSGSGKTTLLRLIAGLERVQKGKICIGDTLLGDGIHHIPPARRGVGMVFQDIALFPHLSVLDNVLFAVRNRDKQLAHQLLTNLGIDDLAHRYPHQLSGGQAQRVAVCRTMAAQPRVVLLDEAFSGLDKCTRIEVRQAVLRHLKQVGTTVLLVTHEADEALLTSRHIAVMNEGKIIQQGTPYDLTCKPASALVMQMISPVNRFAALEWQGNTAITPIGRLSFHRDVRGREICIRPEGILLSDNQNDPTGQVEDCRLLGKRGLLSLRTSNATVLASAEITGGLPHLGAQVHFKVDTRQAFVF